MTHRNREGRLERAAQLHNQRQAERIVPLLCSMATAATRAREVAASKQAAVLQQLQDSYSVNQEEVRAGGAWHACWLH